MNIFGLWACFNNKIVFCIFFEAFAFNSGHNICFKLRNKKMTLGLFEPRPTASTSDSETAILTATPLLLSISVLNFSIQVNICQRII